MNFSKHRLRKTCLNKCLKSRVLEDPIITAAPLPYLLITMEVITLEKVSFSDVENPKTVS